MKQGQLVLFAAMDSSALYAAPRQVGTADECHFYHVMEIPGHGMTQGGHWDLRGGEGDYLGHVDLSGRRVLEIGPASGYLSFFMESRGADVVSVELSPDLAWDAVPDAHMDVKEFSRSRTAGMEGLRNGYWFAHERLRSKARVHYGNVYDLPDELGHFDIAVLCAVLLHVRDPLRVVENCARLSDSLVVTDLHHADVPDDVPMLKWLSTPDSPSLDTWWKFSPQLFVRFGEVLGFTNNVVTYHDQTLTLDGPSRSTPMFTVVSTGRPSPVPR